MPPVTGDVFDRIQSAAERLMSETRTANNRATELLPSELHLRDVMAAHRSAECNLLKLKADAAEACKSPDCEAARRAVTESQALAAWENQLWAKVAIETANQLIEQASGAADLLDKASQFKVDATLVAAWKDFGQQQRQRKADAEKLIAEKRKEFDAAIAEFGRVDVLVNNAFKGPNFKLFADDDLESWRKVYDVNVFGALQLTQAVVPHMKKGGGGSIVFINTMSTRIIEPAYGSYASSKGALMIAAQTLAKELGRDKIRVNSVVPGYIWGASLAGYFQMLAKQQGTTPEAVKAEVASHTALNHIPDSAEIADAVVFFASDLSRVVTGQALDVNGGHFFH